MLRVGVPILGVIVMIAVILIIAFEVNRANRRGALELADDVLAAASARITDQVTSYFAIPTRALEEGETIGEHESAGAARRALIEKFSIGAMNHVPQIADFIVGDSAGDFSMFRRGDSGGIDTKLIDNTPKARKVTWTRRNAAGDEIRHEEDPTDAFDPRTRPWYSGALTTSGILWTDVYVFYTANEPGITASKRYQSPEGRDFVIGVDITLANLSEFLANLKIGESGRAMIIGDQGRVIAHPRSERIIKHDDPDPVVARVDEIGDAAAAAAYDRFRVDGPGRKTITVDGKRYLTSLTPLEAVGRNWSVMTVVAEKDFIGFVEHNNRRALFMSLAIVVLAATGAVLLVRQGLRGDRVARLMRDRSRAMARQSEVLDRVADEADRFDPGHPEEALALTEIAAEVTGARRANLWYLAADGNVLRCTDSFDSQSKRHTEGFELHRAELPRFFDEIAAGTAIDVGDAALDPRTAELYRLTMAPLGSRSLSVVPMRRGERAVGAIGLHDATDIDRARHCLRILASVAALCAGDGVGGPQGAEAETIPDIGEPDTVHSFTADLSLRGVDVAALGDALYPEVSVLVIKITNGMREPELLDEVIRAVQKSAADQEIPYLKLVGSEIVGAAGFNVGDPNAASRIANAALSSRDRLAALLNGNNREPDFRIGIDSGAAIGRYVGSDPALFNLWGETVQTAQTMAATGLPGAIQTSEATFERLGDNFLFRPRGTFYLPPVGRARTFILAGQL